MCTETEYYKTSTNAAILLRHTLYYSGISDTLVSEAGQITG